MPRKYLMTWIESRQRWMKMHRSKRYVISCKALNVPPTKEASYQAANDWWEKKLAELEMEPPAKDHRVEALEMLAGRPLQSSEEVQEAMMLFMGQIASNPEWEPPEGFCRLLAR